VTEGSAPASRAFGKQLLWTFAIQGAGAVLGLSTIVWLGATKGPAEQGDFSRTKTELEFLLSFGALGLPQALLYFVQSRQLRVTRALRISASAAVLGALGTLLYAAVRGEVTTPALLLLAVASMIWHGHLRAVLLAAVGGRLFNIVTALPQVLVFAGVIGFGLGSDLSPGLTCGIFAAAFGLSGAIAHILSRRHSAAEGIVDGSVAIPRLVRYGAATWSSAIGLNLSLLAFTLLVHDKLPSAELGVFTSGVVLAQLLLTPLNYAIPLLFKRWVEHTVGRRIVGYAFKAAALPLLGAAVFAIAAAAGLRLPWLGEYSKLVPVAWLIFVGVAAEVVAKLLAVALLGAGHPWRASAADLARASFALGAVLVLRDHASLQGVVMAWTASSIVAATALAAARPWLRGTTSPPVELSPEVESQQMRLHSPGE
jgi:O-antigen/teichoic acid export membrane protein